MSASSRCTPLSQRQVLARIDVPVWVDEVYKHCRKCWDSKCPCKRPRTAIGRDYVDRMRNADPRRRLTILSKPTVDATQPVESALGSPQSVVSSCELPQPLVPMVVISPPEEPEVSPFDKPVSNNSQPIGPDWSAWLGSSDRPGAIVPDWAAWSARRTRETAIATIKRAIERRHRAAKEREALDMVQQNMKQASVWLDALTAEPVIQNMDQASDRVEAPTSEPVVQNMNQVSNWADAPTFVPANELSGDTLNATHNQAGSAEQGSSSDAMTHNSWAPWTMAIRKRSTTDYQWPTLDEHLFCPCAIC